MVGFLNICVYILIFLSLSYSCPNFPPLLFPALPTPPHPAPTVNPHPIAQNDFYSHIHKFISNTYMTF